MVIKVIKSIKGDLMGTVSDGDLELPRDLLELSPEDEVEIVDTFDYKRDEDEDEDDNLSWTTVLLDLITRAPLVCLLFFGSGIGVICTLYLLICLIATGIMAFLGAIAITLFVTLLMGFMLQERLSDL